MGLSIKHILLAFDNSQQSIVALNTACFFKARYHAQLTIVHIEERISNEEIRIELKKHIGNEAYNFIHKHDRPYRGIIEAANETDADLIIMGTHGTSGFEEFWMGSTAYKVVSSTQCPVLTMRENSKQNNFHSIVLPIDTSFESRQKVPFVISLAKQLNSTIHILGVSVENDNESLHQVNVYTRQVKKSIEEENIPFTLEYKLGGNITKSTIEYAGKINADLIIIMTEQEAQIGSFFLGKFAQQMVNHSTIPVISIAPREDLLLTDAKL